MPGGQQVGDERLSIGPRTLIEVDANDKVLREYVVSPRPIPAAA